MRHIQYGQQNISKDDVRAVLKVLRSDYLTQGPAVKRFEQDLARAASAKYAVAVNNGTAALHLAYLAAGIKEGDEVITTPNTFVATTNMLLAIGARPVFCDIRRDTYNLDERQLEKLITKKTKAIVPVHFAGQPCAMSAILKIAKRHKLIVIEDAAHALGAQYRQRPIGGLASTAACFSFHPVKPITTGEGGAIVTNDRKIYEKALSLRSHGITKDKAGFNVMKELGFNYRLTDFQSALGSSQLQRLNQFIAQRQAVVAWYRQELQAVSEISLPEEQPGVQSSWHLYVVTLKQGQRNELAEFLKKNGVGVNFHYPPVYRHPYYRQPGYRRLSLPVMEDYFAHCLTLPIHTRLSRADVHFIASKIKQFFYESNRNNHRPRREQKNPPKKH